MIYRVATALTSQLFLLLDVKIQDNFGDSRWVLMRKGNIGLLRWWNGWMLELPFELVSPFPSYSRHFSFLSWSSFFGRQLASSRYEEILFHHIRAIFSFGSLKLPALSAHKHITHQMDKFNSSLDYFRASETVITCCLRKSF